MTILQLNNVGFRYTPSKAVLENINCNFDTGVFYAIVGKSGAGKSTLMSLMAGLDLPTEGEILFQGSPTSGMDLGEYRRRHASVIYQDFALLPLLTVQENIQYPMALCGIDAKEAAEQAKELAQRVSLPAELLDRYPSQISGGEQQRVAIARSLALDRRLLLADEPTGNLDTENSDTVIALLKRLAHQEDRCVIVVTHDLTLMDQADVVYRVQDGHLSRR